MKIFIVDDEPKMLTSHSRLLKQRGIRNVEICDNGSEAITRIKEQDFDIVLLDFLMPEVDGLQVLESTKPYKPHTEFIMLTGVSDLTTVVKAIRLGAYDYLVKPVDTERLLLTIQRAYEHKGLITGLAGARSHKDDLVIPKEFDLIITQDPRMKELLSYTQIMARGGNPILITGESGTGKELLAQGIHRAGQFSGGPFIAVNVSSIPETLFESYFFGHVKGAFTGAVQDFAGYFEQTNNGTIFLDEIGELPLILQTKFLRVLEEKTITRIGETKSKRVDFCIVSATSKDLNEACKKGSFRLDLFYRIKSAHVHLPPLRERKGDISLLAHYFLKKACERHKKDIHDFSSEAMELLISRDFPGNIRELAQVVENAVLLAETNTILPDHLGTHELSYTYKRSLDRLCSLKENEEAHVSYVLSHTKGDKKQAAHMLGISVRQLNRKLAVMKNPPEMG